MNKYYKLIHNDNVENGPLQLKNISGVDAGFSIVVEGTPSHTPNLEYSLDGTTWTAYDFTNLPTITVPADGQIYLRGVNTNGINRGGGNYYIIHMDQNYELVGNLMYIIDYNNLETTTNIGGLQALSGLFKGETHLIYSHKANFGYKLKTIARYNLHSMFMNCTNLLTPLDLSTWQVTFGDQAEFTSMYENCTSLKYCPDFSSITSVYNETFSRTFYGCTSLNEGADFSNIVTFQNNNNNCFMNTYTNCTSLTVASKMGNALFSSSNGTMFQGMYQGCTSLVEGMDMRNITLPSTSSNTFQQMYQGCTKLKVAYLPIVTNGVISALTNTFQNVPSGTLYVAYGCQLPNQDLSNKTIIRY